MKVQIEIQDGASKLSCVTEDLCWNLLAHVFLHEQWELRCHASLSLLQLLNNHFIVTPQSLAFSLKFRKTANS